MKMRFLWLILLSGLCLSGICLAQQTGTITGKIIDSEAKTPLANVSVQVKSLSKGVISQNDGTFTLKDIPYGTYDLSISCIGFQQRTIRNISVNQTLQTIDNVQLSPIPLQGAEVVTTATRHRELLDNTPEVTMVISGRDIALTSPRTISDLMPAFPGVNTLGGTGVGVPTKRTVSIDGMPAQYSLILLDGTRVLSSHIHTGVDVNCVPPENIDHIELVKGAVSAQYGSDGMGGAVNIITKSGTDNPELLFTTYGGTQNTFHSSLSLRGKVTDDIRHSAFASWEQSDGPPLEVFADRVGQIDYGQFDFMDRVDANLSDALSLNAQVLYKLTSYPYKSEMVYHSSFASPKLGLNYRITDALYVDASLYDARWTDERLNELNEVRQPNLIINYSGWSKNNLLVGGEYLAQKFRRNDEGMETNQHKRGEYGFFAQDEWTPINQISLLGAMRFDKVEGIDGVVTPKLTAMFKPTEILTVRASVGRGFRSPSLQDIYETIFAHNVGSEVFRVGNKDLKPEYSVGTIGSIEFEPVSQLSVVVDGYFTRINDMIVLVPHDSVNVYHYFTPAEIPEWNPADSIVNIDRRENVNKANVFGGEIKLRWNFLADCVFETGFSLTHNENAITGEQLPYFPGIGVSAKLSGARDFADWLNVGGFIGLDATNGRKYVLSGEELADEGLAPTGVDIIGKLKDYQKLNAGLNITLNKKYEIFATAENLLGQSLEYHEDVLLVIKGTPQFYVGLRLRAF